MLMFLLLFLTHSLNAMEQVKTPAMHIAADTARSPVSSPLAKSSDEAKARAMELEEMLAAVHMGRISCNPSALALNHLEAPLVVPLTGSCTLVTADKGKHSLSRQAAMLSGTFRKILAQVNGESAELNFEDIPAETGECLAKCLSAIAILKSGNNYGEQLHSTLKNFVEQTNIVTLLLFANYLDIPILRQYLIILMSEHARQHYDSENFKTFSRYYEAAVPLTMKKSIKEFADQMTMHTAADLLRINNCHISVELDDATLCTLKAPAIISEEGNCIIGTHRQTYTLSLPAAKLSGTIKFMLSDTGETEFAFEDILPNTLKAIAECLTVLSGLKSSASYGEILHKALRPNIANTNIVDLLCAANYLDIPLLCNYILASIIEYIRTEQDIRALNGFLRYCSLKLSRDLSKKVFNYKEQFEERLKRQLSHRNEMLQPEASVTAYLESGERILISQDLAQRLASLDKKGVECKPEDQLAGGHRVNSWQGMHFKAHDGKCPLDPGEESGAFELLDVLFPSIKFPTLKILTPTNLLVLDNVQTPEGPKVFIVQASETIRGDECTTLIDEIDALLVKKAALFKIQKKNEQAAEIKKIEAQLAALYEKIDKSTFSAHAVRSLLTASTDDKEDNFRKRPCKDGVIYPVGIDDDKLWGPVPTELVINRTGNQTQTYHVPGIRSMFLLMQNPMSEPLDSRIADHLRITDPVVVIEEWLGRLQLLNERYKKLEPILSKIKETAPDRLAMISGYDLLNLPIKLRPHTVDYLLFCLNELRYQIGKATNVSHNTIFAKINPLLQRYYMQVTKGTESLRQAYEFIRSTTDTHSLEKVLNLHTPLGDEPTHVVLEKHTMTQESSQKRTISIAEALRDLKRKDISLHFAHASNSDSTLHTAISNLSEDEVLSRLANFNGNLEALDDRKLSALDCAFERGFKKVVCELVRKGAGKHFDKKKAHTYFDDLQSKGLLDKEACDTLLILESLHADFAWLRFRKFLFADKPSPESKQCKLTTHNKTVYLNRACNGMWDEQGNFIRKNKYGRRNCNSTRFPASNGVPAAEVWFKELPFLPGFEFAVGTLYRLANATGVPFADLASIDGKPFLISTALEGVNLYDALLEQEQKFPSIEDPRLLNLEPESTHMMIFFDILTDEEDGRPDNQILQRSLRNRSKYTLGCPDSENRFVATMAYNKSGQLVRQTKSVKLCLNEMKEAIPKKVKEDILDIKAPEYFLTWLNRLSAFQTASHSFLFPDAEMRACFWAQKDKECFIGVPLSWAKVRRMYAKFLKMQKALRCAHVVTPFDLLYEINSPLADIYKDAFTESTILKRFEKVDRDLYDKCRDGIFGPTRPISIGGNKERFISHNIPTADHDNIAKMITSGTYISPHEALIHLQSFIADNWVTCDKLSDFDRCRTTSEKEKFLDNTNFGSFTEEQQKDFFAKNPLNAIEWGNLQLRSASYLADQLFRNLTLVFLLKLNLSGCTKISAESLQTLRECPWLESLNLTGLTQLTGYPLLRFPALVKLVLDKCTGLRGINLDAPTLAILLARDCTQLIGLNAPSKSLRVLDIENAKELTNDTFEYFLRNAPHLRKLCIQGCAKIAHRELRQACPQYPSKDYANSGKWKDIILLLLKNHPDLTTLYLGNDKCTNFEFRLLCLALAFNHHVKTLNLGRNKDMDSESTASSLKELLEKNGTLRTLDLAEIAMNEQGLQTVISALQKNSSLTKLDMSV